MQRWYAVTLQRQLRNPFVPIRRSWCGRAPACRLDHSPVTSALDRLGPEQPLHAPQLYVKLARAASLFDEGEGVDAYMRMRMRMHKHAQLHARGTWIRVYLHASRATRLLHQGLGFGLGFGFGLACSMNVSSASKSMPSSMHSRAAVSCCCCLHAHDG